jgi:hypothetical protein
VNPDTRNKIILGVLMLVAAIVVVYQLTRGTGTTTTPTTTNTPRTTQSKNAPTTTPAGGAAARTSTASAASPATFQEVEVDVDALLRDIEAVNFDYQAERIDRDPMTPLVGIVRPQAGMDMAMAPSRLDVLNKKVTGIILDGQSPAAVVDDEVVQEGYVYPDGTMVYDIERDRVVFKIGDSLIPVEMKKLGMR